LGWQLGWAQTTTDGGSCPLWKSSVLGGCPAHWKRLRQMHWRACKNGI